MNEVGIARWFKVTGITALLVLLTILLSFTAAGAQTGSEGRSSKEESSGATGSPQLLQRAEEEGSVRVIAQLRTDFVPEGRLSQPQVADQRSEIQSAQAGLKADLQGTGYQSLREYDTIPFIALKLTPRALEALQRSPLVSSVVEDVADPVALAESTPIVQAPTMWNGGFTGSGQVVAVLDTGVDSSHPFLAGKVIEEACYAGDDGTGRTGPGNCPNGTRTQTGPGSGVHCTYVSDCDHGTHVAGIAAGQGSTFSGVAKGANVMSVQVFSRFTGADCGPFGGTCTRTYRSDQIAGLERVYALRSTRNFASVNMSLGGGQYFSNCDTESPGHKAAIDNLRSANIPTVIASGNRGFTNSMGFPACISSAVSVGSTTKQDQVSSFSNSASFLHLLAPGSSINSSVLEGGFASKNGTSMAAPHVAGAWALLKQAHPSATVSSVLSALQSTGTPVTEFWSGIAKPRINIADASATFGGGGDTTAPSVSLTGPAPNAIVRNGLAGAVTISANASDNVGVSKVEFLVNGAKVGEATSAPYSMRWDSKSVLDGHHTITTRAFDAAGNQATSAGHPVIVDNFYPDTVINSGPPARTSSTRASFRFSSPNPDVIGFECSLDRRAFTSCSSPKTYSGLSSKRHVFSVRAIGSAGATIDTDPTPASKAWSVAKKKKKRR